MAKEPHDTQEATSTFYVAHPPAYARGSGNVPGRDREEWHNGTPKASTYLQKSAY